MTKSLFAETCAAVDVAVALPITNVFSYAVPENLLAKISPGVRVRVPFKNRDIVAYVVGEIRETSPEKLKFVLDVLDDEPVLTPVLLKFTRWIADYYGSSWGEAIENTLPRWVKYGKKAQRALNKQRAEDVLPPAPVLPENAAERQLSSDQQRAFDFIEGSLQAACPKPILLFGVTGSGKSELYIRAIRRLLERSRASICLVPEIALTEQLRRFFANHFGNHLEILHSKLNDTERFLAWKRIEKGGCQVVLGPRSAVFAPVRNLGLIIMDEEHEGSYKQETVPRYHAREAAEWRAREAGALFLMGTATPSLETMVRAQEGEIERIDLAERIDRKAMPEVKVVDLKASAPSRKLSGILTPPLAVEIETNLKRREGTLLLLNRRGFSTHIHCRACGRVESCGACQVSLTFHQEDDTLLCHYCNFKKPAPARCGQCGADLLRFSGFGTERVESEVARRFPHARIARMDADSVRKKGSHEAILKEFRDRRTDILIGTQMIAKGFDFPHVTLVGVILADVGLMLPDFRSAERTFQLLTQVAGRAGRGDLPGRVVIQTYSPEHPSIRYARKHDYLNFFGHEAPERRLLRYPPYCRLINVIVRARSEKPAYVFARALRENLDQCLVPSPAGPSDSGMEEIEIIGPAPLPFYKLRGHYRWHVMLKIPRQSAVTQPLAAVLAGLKKPAGVACAVDVDPLNIL